MIKRAMIVEKKLVGNVPKHTFVASVKTFQVSFVFKGIIKCQVKIKIQKNCFEYKTLNSIQILGKTVTIKHRNAYQYTILSRKYYVVMFRETIRTVIFLI